MLKQLCLWLACLASAASPAAEPAPAAAGKAEALMAAYRGTTNVVERWKCLKALEKYHGPAVDQFLVAEFSKLDGAHAPDARLAGGILQRWAAKPTGDVLPYLVFEGLFHADAEVVRASAAGLAQRPEETKALLSTGQSTRGTDVGEELAADLIQRMNERGDLLPALERVLVLWTGKQRDGYRAEASLKRTPKEADRAAALAFWTGWYETRFRKKLKL